MNNESNIEDWIIVNDKPLTLSRGELSYVLNPYFDSYLIQQIKEMNLKVGDKVRYF